LYLATAIAVVFFYSSRKIRIVMSPQANVNLVTTEEQMEEEFGHEWLTGPSAWDGFVKYHPELGFPKGRWGFHNFLRNHKEKLCKADAIRLARNKFWIAHQSRFNEQAFALATVGRNSVTGQELNGVQP
jgi:hypothetical protein